MVVSSRWKPAPVGPCEAGSAGSSRTRFSGLGEIELGEMTSNTWRALLSMKPADAARSGARGRSRWMAADLRSLERLRVTDFFQSLASGLVLLSPPPTWRRPLAGGPADLDLRHPAEISAGSEVPISSR